MVTEKDIEEYCKLIDDWNGIYPVRKNEVFVLTLTTAFVEVDVKNSLERRIMDDKRIDLVDSVTKLDRQTGRHITLGNYDHAKVIWRAMIHNFYKRLKPLSEHAELSGATELNWMLYKEFSHITKYIDDLEK